MTTCSLPDCSRPAVSSFVLIPRRTDEPITPEIRRAMVWPGVELPCQVAVCHEHRQAVKDAAKTVIAETPLGDAEPAVRVVDGEGGA